MLSVMDRRRQLTTEGDESLFLLVKGPDAATQGVIDVVSLRALARVVSFIVRSKEHRETYFERPLKKINNVNGALAKAILESNTIHASL